MVALLWVVLALGLLWLWLSGHWFGRALMFLLGAVIAAAIASLVSEPHGAALGALSLIVGTVTAWVIASIPAAARGRAIFPFDRGQKSAAPNYRLSLRGRDEPFSG